uniref:Uncharacterized protein n=1 Tax=Panagrolaimus sp. ES5 TaxID=591445 RepID=A0AC34FDX7_9BILA
MFLFFIILFFCSLSPAITTSTTVVNPGIEKCKHPFPEFKAYYRNVTDAQQNFPTHYIFLLNTNLDNNTQKQMLIIYRSITCVLQYNTKNSTKFHLITVGNDSNSQIFYGPNPETWISTFQNSTFSSSSLESGIQKASLNQKVLNICDQLIDGLQQFVFEKEEGGNREALMHGLKNFVMFQMIDNYSPEKCETALNEFLKKHKLTNTIGISQNVITVGSAQQQNLLSPSMINETSAFESIQKDPRFFTGALINLKNLDGFDNSDIVYTSMEPFVDEMLMISGNFIQAYTILDSNETIIRMVETLFDDFPFSNITTTQSPISSPSIKTVTIFALILALCFLAFIIIVSSYDQSLFTDQNYIRERARQFRGNYSRRNNSETVGLVEVPIENLSETIFGESPRVQSFSDSVSSFEEAALLPSRVEEESVNIRCPNLYIQIDDDNLAEVKLTE